MIEKLRASRAWLVGIVACLALVWIVETSDSFKGCITQQQAKTEQRGFYEQVAHFSFLIGRRKDCLGTLVHQNEGAITALATLLIALFTLTLWRATDKLWEA